MKHAVLQLINTIADRLQPLYKDEVSSQQTAWWMLQAITNHTRAALLAHEDIDLSQEQEVKLNLWIQRQLKENVPLQYLIGWVPFADLKILVESPVLIPRPETEEWVYRVIKMFKQLQNQKLTILDIGTGSGCLALALASAFKESMVYATDISDEALSLAEKNKKLNGIDNIRFIKSDVYSQVPNNLFFDLIVSNPPYITPDEWENLDPMVTKWEDRQALVAQDEGLVVIRQIITLAPGFIKKNEEMAQLELPQVIIEIGYKQAEAVTKIMHDAHYPLIEVWQDLEEKDRVVAGRVP